MSIFKWGNQCSTYQPSTTGKIILRMSKKLFNHIGIACVTCPNLLKMGIRMGAMKSLVRTLEMLLNDTSVSALVAAWCSLQATRQIWGIWKLRLAYSPEKPNLGQNRWCFVPCDLEIWRMTLENDRASLLCCFKLCATFHSHWWIQTGVTVRKHPFWVKFDDF